MPSRGDPCKHDDSYRDKDMNVLNRLEFLWRPARCVEDGWEPHSTRRIKLPLGRQASAVRGLGIGLIEALSYKRTLAVNNKL